MEIISQSKDVRQFPLVNLLVNLGQSQPKVPLNFSNRLASEFSNYFALFIFRMIETTSVNFG